ncbi:MAG: type II secretion system minor pseudopilin GspK [Rubrivivax sp.]
MTARRPPARGAALLLAMLILSLVAVLAAAMVRHQQRAIEIEAAERARTQAGWVLNGAIDWARLILREDARSGPVDHEGEPWAVPLAEARLSTFLAADQSNNVDADLDAFISGRIVDLQSRYNLVRVAADDGKPVEPELAALRRLCEAAGLGGDVADRLGRGMVNALDGGSADGPLRPRRLSQLTWLGLDAPTLAQLEGLVVLLPVRTPVNANTAPREVLLAAIDGIDLGTAERIVQARQRAPLRSIPELRNLLPEGVTVDEGRVGVGSSFFLVQGRVRLEDRVVEERAVIERRPGGGEVLVRQRERVSLAPAR